MFTRQLAMTLMFFGVLHASNEAGLLAGPPPVAGSQPVQGAAVSVYLEESGVVPKAVLLRSQQLAATMFATADVQIDWHVCRRDECDARRDGSIVIGFLTRTPEVTYPGALAFARPIEGVHIGVFYDRIQKVREGMTPVSLGQVLAHVLVHEITHILQGVSRHSDSGIMKAHWSGKDYTAMLWKPMHFTPGDLMLIQGGLAARARMLTNQEVAKKATR